MATRVKYKFGDDEFDLKDYIHNLETNYQSYVASKNWNEGQQQEFKNAFDKYLTGLKDQLSNNTGRFYTDYSGAIFDNKGEFSNTDDDNIDPVGSEYYYNNKGQRITTDDYNLLRKRKQKNFNTFSANRQVATYLNKVGIALRDYSKQNPSNNSSNAFNLSKHGFEKYWMDQNNPSGGDFDFAPYVEKDQIGEGGVRGTSNRAAYLKEQLENYIKNLGDYDFSSTTFKDKDTYLAKLRAAMENLDNGYNHEDAIALNQAGLSSSFLNNFFGTGEQQQKSEVEQAAEYIAAEQKRQQDQEIIDQAARMKAMSELDQWAKDNQFQPKYSGVLEGGDYDPDAILSMLEKDYADIEGDDNKVKAWLNFEQLLKDIREPMIEADAIINGQPVSTIEGSKAAMRKLRANLAQKLKFAAQEGYMKAYGDEYIIPGSEDYSNYSLITYNPVTGEYKDQSVILNEKLREAMAYDWYKKNQVVSSNKNGGILSYLQEGGFMKRAREARQQRKQQEQPQQKVQQEQENNRTKEQKEAGQRKISDGLSGTDIARLAAIGMDLTSAVSSFVPGAGTAVSGITGIGSTLTTLGADIAEDGFQWSDLGNAGVGLGMDIVGMIPGFGTAGKAPKIGKQLVKFAPLVLGALQAQNALSEPSKKSWQKIIDGKFKDLTVDDLRNLASGVTAFTSLSNQVGIRMKNSAMKSATKTGDKTIESKTGEMVRITPEKLEELRKAKSLKDQNAILQSIPGNEGKELGSNLRGNFNITRLWDNNPRIADHYDWSRLRGTVFDNSSLPSDAQIFQSVRQSNFGTINWHLRLENPYNKLLNKKNKASLKPTNNRETSRKRFDKAVDKSIQTRDQIRTIEYWKKRYSKRLQGKSDKEILDIIREQQQLSKKEKGGILSRVRKFQNAGKFPEWYSKLYKFQNLTGWNNSLNQSLAGSSITNENAGHYRAGDLNEAYTKNNSYTSNPNLVGQDLQSYYDSSFKGKSLDDYVSAYNANAAKIRGYWDQERTYKQSGAQEHNRLFKNMFGNRSDNSNNVWNIGYDSNLEDIVGSSTWLRRMDRYEKEFDNLSDEEKKSRVHKIDLGDGNFGYVYKKANGDIAVWNQPETPATSTNPADSQTTPTIISVIQPSQEPSNDNKQNKSFFSNINPTIAYGLPRAVYADRMNRRITDLAKESVVPLLKDPLEVHRYTRSDLDAEMQGERNYANLRRLASRPITSDGSLQTATQLQAEVQGQEARTAGKEKSNQVQRQYDELAWQQEKENAANRHETAMFNRAQQWGADQDKSKFEQAYLSKKFNIWDTFGQQLEFEARSRQQESKAIADRFAYSDIQNAVNSDPNRYGVGLTEEELALHKRLQAGIAPSQLISENNNNVTLLSSIRQKLSQAQQAQLSQYYNINPSKWAGVRSAQNPRK